MKKAILFVLCVAICVAFAGCDREKQPTNYENAMLDGAVTILVDAGHGLSDVGAINEENLGTVTEAAINFSVASELAGELAGRGYTVIMSHDGITKPDTEYDDGEETYGPSERSDFSNSTAADIFISIHCDSFPSNADVYGTRIYYPVNTPNSTKLDKQLASAAANAVDTAFPDAKKVILRDMHGEECYTVLYKTVVPSILVECGFITNKGDAEKLLDTEWHKAFALSLANGIDEYFKK